MSAIAATQKSPSALLVGTVDILLSTRKAILEHQGFTVSIVTPANVAALLGNADPHVPVADVIVACHTLSEDEIKALGSAISARPEKPPLVGFVKSVALSDTSPFDASVWSLASPGTFVDVVRSVLNSPRTRAKSYPSPF